MGDREHVAARLDFVHLMRVHGMGRRHDRAVAPINVDVRPWADP